MMVVPSPSMPIEMAMPPSDIRLAEMPAMRMQMTANRAQNGSASDTTNDDRKFPRKTASTAITSRPPCHNAVVTVPLALVTSSACS